MRGMHFDPLGLIFSLSECKVRRDQVRNSKHRQQDGRSGREFCNLKGLAVSHDGPDGFQEMLARQPTSTSQPRPRRSTTLKHAAQPEKLLAHPKIFTPLI